MSASQPRLNWTVDKKVMALVIPPLGWEPFRLREITIKKATDKGEAKWSPQLIDLGSLKDDHEIARISPILEWHKDPFKKLPKLEPVEDSQTPITKNDIYDLYYQKPMKAPAGTMATRMLEDGQQSSKDTSVTINKDLSQNGKHEDIIVNGWAMLFKRDTQRGGGGPLRGFVSLNEKFGGVNSAHRDAVLDDATQAIRQKMQQDEWREKERLEAQSEAS